MSKEKDLFEFTDDEFIAIQMHNGALRDKVRVIMEEAITKITAEFIAVREMQGDISTSFARHASIAQAMSEGMMFASGYVYGRIMPADVGAVYVSSMLNDFCRGYNTGTKELIDVDFSAGVSVKPDAKDVQESVILCTKMAVLFNKAISAFMRKEKNGDKPNRPSSTNKIV